MATGQPIPPELLILAQRVLNPEGVGQWLSSPNHGLEGRTPIEEFRTNGPDQLKAILEAMAEGVFI